MKYHPFSINSASLFIYFVTGVVYSIIGPSVLAICREFNMSLGSMGLLFVCQLGGCFLGVFFGGLAVDRFGPKKILLAGILLMTAGLALSGGAVFRTMLAAGFLLFGIGLGCIDSSANALVAKVNPDTAVRQLGLLHAFFGVGAVAAPIPTAALLLRTGSFRWAFIITAALSAVGFIIFALLSAPQHTPATSKSLSSISSLLRKPRFLLLALFLLPCMGTEMAVNSWLTTYLKKELNTGMVLASTCMSIYWGGLLAGRLASSAVAIRVGAERMLWFHTALQIAAAVGLVITTSPVFTIVMAFMLGYAISADYPLAIAIISKEEDEAPGAATGGLFAAGGIGATIIPPLVGFTAEYSSLRVGLGLFIPFAVLMGILLFLRRNQGISQR